jgi:hypothetical protein
MTLARRRVASTGRARGAYLAFHRTALRMGAERIDAV